MKRIFSLSFFLTLFTLCHAQEWIPVPQEAKPYTRWWWLGSAVDKEGLTYNLEELSKAGIGGVEITPIYGVQGNDANEILYLSPKWMQMLQHVESEGARLGIETNMATGTGWPFGGPLVSEADAAKKMDGLTKQMVKRAAPGGEGYVIDHFDKQAVANYLARFDTAFVNQGVKFPHTFFNDSYEVYGADWTTNLLSEFKARRGYDLAPHLGVLKKEESLRTDDDKRILSDYRETLGDLLLENFTTQWTDWAHSHGSITRNQAHGSPANLLDLYAEVDIPECEGFGLSNFNIKGLRVDSGFTKKNFSDISMLKYASSGAHLSGHNLTSSETFTWLTEHFRTSLSQCKPDLDLFFISGINHVFFHGSCYSPKDAEWPGWRFYASVDMSPANNWWSSMPAFSKYISRCQAFLQWGKPDNDVLVYLPYYDMIYDQPGTVALFDIHSMEKRAPKFINTVQSIIKLGYDVDYVSDRYLLKDDVTARYRAIIVPDVQFMPLKTLKQLNALAAGGYKVIFVKNYPSSVPGYNKKAEQKEFMKVLKQIKAVAVLADDYGTALSGTSAKPEPMRFQQGLSCIRRSNPEGYHYFVSNLQGKDVDGPVSLGTRCVGAVFYNPMNGDISKAQVLGGGSKVLMQLKSGESIIVRTFAEPEAYEAFLAANPKLHAHKYYNALEMRSTGLKGWTLTFKESAPKAITKTYTMAEPTDWTTLGDDDLKVTMATGVYHTTIDVPRTFINQRNPYAEGAAAYILDLGDVRETARVIINGKEAGTLFAVPYRIDVTDYLIAGKNTIDIEVSNLPANRIAQLDRDKVQWRKFKEINVVDLNYKKTLYDYWTPVPSGLCSEVKLIPAVLK